MKQQETRHAVGRLLNRLVIWLYGQKCNKCGKRHHETKRGIWTRGYNEYCRQATGDWGTRCYECGHIEWDQSLEDYKKFLPDWCRAYDDR